MTNEELLIKSQELITDIKNAMEDLKLALAVEEECTLPFPDIKIYVGKNTDSPGICINRLWRGDEEELHKIFRDRLNHVKAKAKCRLITADAGREKEDAAPREEAAEKNEEPAKAAGQDMIVSEEPKAEKVRPKKTVSTDIISDDKLHELYFIRGRKIKDIAEQYQIGVAGLYKRLEKMQKKIGAAEKEDARR